MAAGAPNPQETAQPAEAPVPVPEPSEKALRYYRSGVVLWWVRLGWGFALPALFLFTGWSARLRDFSRRVGHNWFFTIVCFVILFELAVFVLDLPLSFYQSYLRPHAYGLSNQTLGKWLGDALKGLMVGAVAGAAFLWVPYLLLRKSPRRWWLYTGLLTLPFGFFVMLVAPVWIDPLFNEFGPMKDRQLERRILALAEQAGIAGSRVYEVNKSVDTETVNAYVTGFGTTKRIVLWDTLLRKLDEDEVLFVMGHEMGHYVLGHVTRSVLVLSAMALLGLYGAYRLSGWFLRRFQERFRFTELADIASLPLLMLLVQLVSVVLTPAALAYSRYQEREADRFGLEITQNGRACATAFVKLQRENLSHPRPGPLYKLWRASHPTLAERIEFCNRYRPWAEGRPLKYASRLRLREGVSAGDRGSQR